LLLIGQQATESELKTSGILYRRLHIASHGQFKPQDPLSSRLLLSKDKINDGDLTVRELYNLRLDSDMVVLSACETGLGKISNGDDVIGLNRGFLYSGAKSIISSLWVVEDQATMTLMTTLYKNLDQKHDKGESLRLAQLYVKENINNHPFFWGAFQLTGLH
jgi:CHAT domain-containing protein